MEQEKCSVWTADSQALEKARQALELGKVVGVPTETVYGLAARGDEDHAVARIFAVKQRPNFNPLILHYGNWDALLDDVVFTPTARLFADAFWPGPLTLILPKKLPSRLSLLVSAGLDTVAVRMPKHPWFRALLASLPFPLAAPSANRSGHLSPTLAEHVLEDLGEELPLLIDDGASILGIESTVIDVCGSTPWVLREGSIPREQLEAVWGSPLQITHAAQPDAPSSPGMLESHYAPRQPLRLDAIHVESDEGLLAFGPEPCSGTPFIMENLSKTGDLQEAAANLFACLHRLEHSLCQRIAAKPIPDEGIGRAICDRLRRAATGR